MGHPYLRSTVGGAHRREYHGGGTVTMFKLANDSASPAAVVEGKVARERRGELHSGQPKKGCVYGIKL